MNSFNTEWDKEFRKEIKEMGKQIKPSNSALNTIKNISNEEATHKAKEDWYCY